MRWEEARSKRQPSSVVRNRKLEETGLGHSAAGAAKGTEASDVWRRGTRGAGHRDGGALSARARGAHGGSGDYLVRHGPPRLHASPGAWGGNPGARADAPGFGGHLGSSGADPLGPA